MIGPEGIKMEKEKVKGVLEWPTPKCVKDVQKFLGLANYYRRFIEGFAMVARPLHDLRKKNKKWEWTEKEEKTFRELKERFTKELVLAAPDIDKKNEDGGGCIRLCDEGSINNGVQGWIVEAGGISFQVIKRDRKKL